MEILTESEKILLETLSRWGHEAQRRVVIGKMAFLTQAICQYERTPNEGNRLLMIRAVTEVRIGLWMLEMEIGNPRELQDELERQMATLRRKKEVLDNAQAP